MVENIFLVSGELSRMEYAAFRIKCRPGKFEVVSSGSLGDTVLVIWNFGFLICCLIILLEYSLSNTLTSYVNVFNVLIVFVIATMLCSITV